MSSNVVKNQAMFKDKLEKEEVLLIERIQGYEKEIKASQKNTSVDDIASEYEERAKIKGLRKIDEIRLVGVRSALRRIEEGEYGECQTCFELINPKRLESNPLAANCIDCQSKLDIKNKHFR